VDVVGADEGGAAQTNRAGERERTARISAIIHEPERKIGRSYLSERYSGLALVFPALLLSEGVGLGVVVLGVLSLYAWLAFVMLRYELDEDELGPGQVHV
jgi:hypothetical protein